MSRGLTGRVAVVTGGARGIGRAYASRLAADGASVAVIDLADSSGTVAVIEAAGCKGAAVIADVTEPGQVAAAADAVQMMLGAPDILVNNAGIYPNQPFSEMSIDDWRAMSQT